MKLLEVFNVNQRLKSGNDWNPPLIPASFLILPAIKDAVII